MVNLFQIMLRNSYQSLPAVVQQFHDARLGHFEGEAKVSGSSGFLARLLRRLGDLPEPKGTSPLVIKVIRTEVRERWLRKFGEGEFASTLSRVNRQNLLCENFGLFTLYYTLAVRNAQIHWHCVSWRFAGLPMPDSIAPDVETWEGSTPEGRYQFKVSLQLPLVGELLGYEGWLAIATAASAEKTASD